MKWFGVLIWSIYSPGYLESEEKKEKREEMSDELHIDISSIISDELTDLEEGNGDDMCQMLGWQTISVISIWQHFWNVADIYSHCWRMPDKSTICLCSLTDSFSETLATETNSGNA